MQGIVTRLLSPISRLWVLPHRWTKRCKVFSSRNTAFGIYRYKNATFGLCICILLHNILDFLGKSRTVVFGVHVSCKSDKRDRDVSNRISKSSISCRFTKSTILPSGDEPLQTVLRLVTCISQFPRNARRRRDGRARRHDGRVQRLAQGAYSVSEARSTRSTARGRRCTTEGDWEGEGGEAGGSGDGRGHVRVGGRRGGQSRGGPGICAPVTGLSDAGFPPALPSGIGASMPPHGSSLSGRTQPSRIPLIFSRVSRDPRTSIHPQGFSSNRWRIPGRGRPSMRSCWGSRQPLRSRSLREQEIPRKLT